MSLKKSLFYIFRKEMFIPSWFSVLMNSNFFIARGISSGIKRNSHHMKGVLLDFGCGSKPYRTLFDLETYIGVDIINTAHSNDVSRVDKFYDGRTIPFEDEYFDSVFSSEVLTHVFNDQEIIPELNRVLKRGGCFLLTVPFVWKENEKPHDNVRYTSFGIKHLLEMNGFEIISHEKSGHYLLTIFQLLNDYLYSTLFTRIKIIRLFLTLIVIFPLNLLGIVLSFILPNNADLFMTSILLARKK